MAPNNALPVWGNEKTMNLNNLILTNIQSSPYFKVNLFELKTYHEVIDEIYYKVNHLEPWEKGSRKTAGQTGMCGGVRGVGAGGIVSSAYCLLYKLFTLKLTKKQLIGLITHADSPYIRGLGFMYIRYTQPPTDLWEWYEEYLDDEEEVDVKAGGGHVMTMGELCRQFLVKLEWYSTLFPRIPVPVQKSIQEKLKSNPPSRPSMQTEEMHTVQPESRGHGGRDEVSFGEAERMASRRSPPRVRRSRSPKRYPSPRHSPRRSPTRRSPPRRHSPRRSPHRQDWERERGRDRDRGSSMNDFSRELEREKQRQRREKEKDKRDTHKRSRSRERNRSRSREKRDHGDRLEKYKSRSAEEHRESKRSGERKSSKSHQRSRSKEKHRSKSQDKKRSRSKDRGYDKSSHPRYEKETHRDLSIKNRCGEDKNGDS